MLENILTGQKKGRRFLFLLLVLSLVFVCPVLAQAKNQWVTRSEGDMYLKKGKAVTGVVKIGKKTYYFDPEGIQRTGWRKIHNKYYFYKQGRKKKGYLLTNRRIDGIWVGKDGKADASSASARRKLSLMVQCQKVVEQVTQVSQSKASKRETLFRFMMNNYKGQAIPSLEARADLDVAYAQFLISNQVGDCYAFGSLYAYFLNAIGYDNPLFVCSGGHGWAEEGSRIYDPHWARIIGFDLCYDVPFSLSGQNGRPKWASNRLYIYAVNDAPRG
ncbi:MAG: hypothetical protein IIZ39_02435 [Blautia sp.]|nr:hypothetical protein [Blautia sp.]